MRARPKAVYLAVRRAPRVRVSTQDDDLNHLLVILRCATSSALRPVRSSSATMARFACSSLPRWSTTN